MQNDFKIVKTRFKNMTRLLKRPKLDSLKVRKNLLHSPWYLVIGQSTSGKTSLLKNSELPFVFSKKLDQEIQTTQYHDWWITQNAVILDIPGKYFDSQNSQSLWHKFLKVFKQDAYQGQLAGLIVVLDIKKLVRSDSDKKYFSAIKESISEVLTYFSKDTPVYFIINKLDLLAGFSEFFYDATLEERQQAFGVIFNQRDIEKTFSTDYDQLIQTLRDRSIWLLQHQNDPEKCDLINHFLLQVIHLKTKLAKLVSNYSDKKIAIKGVFFTSANKQFFVHKLFQKVMASSAFVKKSHSKKSLGILPKLLITACAVVVFGASFIWFKSFKQQTQLIENIQQATVEYHTLDELSLPKNKVLSKKIALLKSINEYAARKKQSLLSWFFTLPEGQRVRHQAQSVVQKALKKLLFDKIIKNLHQSLVDPKTPLVTLYNNLRFYLMIAHLGPVDTNFLNSYAQTLWQKEYPNVSSEDVATYIEPLFAHADSSLQVDQQVIKAAQNRLKRLNPYQLAEVITRAQAEDQLLSLNFATNKKAAQVLTFIHENVYIPSIYTQASFQHVYPAIIQESAKEVAQDNWILGKSAYSQLKLEQFTQTLLNKYLTDYAHIWEKFLNNIGLVNFTDMTQLNQAIQILGDPENSPIKQLIALLQSNLTKEVIAKDPKLASLSRIDSAALQAAFNNLAVYFQSISQAKDMNKAAFDLASLRMRSNGKNDAISNLSMLSQQYPEPIRGWIEQLATNSWQVVLFQAQNYINGVWTKQIFPQYQDQFEGRYPFLSTASTNISLRNFEDFFQPRGLLSNFVRDYLALFLQADQRGRWRPKVLDNASLHLSNDVLERIKRAFDLRNGYFHHAYLNVHFTIKPLEMGSNLREMVVKMGKEKATWRNGKTFKSVNMKWPDNNNSGQVKIFFITDHGKTISIEPDGGSWNIFKLIGQARIIHKASRTGYYEIILNKAGYAVKLLIKLKQHENLFSEQHLANISLPDSLL